MADPHTEPTKPVDPKEKTEATKKRLADEKAQREKARAEQQEAMKDVKPTPTQEENDLAAMGEHVLEHEPDGSPPDDPNAPTTKTRAIESKPGGDYQTRTVSPGPATSPPKPHAT
jgi:hypothetical protein